ncbi:hypothetical protein M5K25_000401 [Dendrobium thyrsiflorum]|uniref:dCMP deaminase n=1 Tax=Dendrobium thyrsiflorum TaxID=117978 RepID=A0ABD0VU70_DENTH
MDTPSATLLACETPVRTKDLRPQPLLECRTTVRPRPGLRQSLLGGGHVQKGGLYVKLEGVWSKESYVVHAEVNAILNTNHASAAGQRLYVTMFPCNECAKVIIQSGVSEVIYFIEKRVNNSDAAYTASHKLLSLAGVMVRKHHPQMADITLKFE